MHILLLISSIPLILLSGCIYLRSDNPWKQLTLRSTLIVLHVLIGYHLMDYWDLYSPHSPWSEWLVGLITWVAINVHGVFMVIHFASIGMLKERISPRLHQHR